MITRKLMGLFLLCPILSWAQYNPLHANPGFENTGTMSNWVHDGTGSTARITTLMRTGGACAEISETASQTSTTHNTSYYVTVPASGTNYVTVMGWARRNKWSGVGTARAGIDAGTTADPNGPWYTW